MGIDGERRRGRFTELAIRPRARRVGVGSTLLRALTLRTRLNHFGGPSARSRPMSFITVSLRTARLPQWKVLLCLHAGEAGQAGAEGHAGDLEEPVYVRLHCRATGGKGFLVESGG